MAITVKSINYSKITTSKQDGIYTFVNPATIIVTYTKNNKTYKLNLKLEKGFRTDGASIPSAFTWFLPKWDTKNMKYNCGAIVHDCLYTLKGVGIFSREESDDFIRGIWRCSGISRFKAGMADKCLELFAGGEKHWGSDDLDNNKKKLMKITVTSA